MTLHQWYQPAMLDETPARSNRLVCIAYTVLDGQLGQSYSTGQVIEPVADRSIHDMPLRWFDMARGLHPVDEVSRELIEWAAQRIGPF